MSLKRPLGAAALRRTLRRPARFIRRTMLPRLLPPARIERPGKPDCVRVVGLLSSPSGVGKSARLCLDVFDRSGFSVSTDDVSDLFGAGAGVSYGAQAAQSFRPGGVSIYHLNPPMLLPGIVRSGLGRYYRSYNIGYWAWELETLPAEWIAAVRYVNAILVPSSFCQAVVQRHTTKPVIVVPHPVPDPVALARPRLPEAGDLRPFRVVSVFNFDSSFERKNPLALVRAFQQAFGDDPSAELVLKTGGHARHGRDLDRLQDAVRESANIRVLNELWDENRLLGFIRDADVFASLHRSEGFGLTLAEAMMVETPVLATNWSGNTDFCRPGLFYPVEYELVPFAAEHTDYSDIATARWAEPSVDDAARQLREIRRDPAAARRRATAQKGALLDYLGQGGYPAVLRDLTMPVGRRA